MRRDPTSTAAAAPTSTRPRLGPYRYAVYGLTVECNEPLPAPALRAAGPGAADVVVDWAGVAGEEDQTPSGSHTIVEESGGWLAVSPSPGFEAGWTRLRFGYAGHF